jgi:hypothetical protein
MSAGGAERATVRIVTGEGEQPVPASQHTDPEARPPVVAPPPQELESDLGGPAFVAPSDDDTLAAEGASVAARMRARFEGMAATKEFSVPGWELEDGRPGLIIVARAFGDRKAYNSGVSNEGFIARSTHQLFFVNDDGTRELIEGGWGPALARIIGVSAIKAADLVALVISKPDPNNAAARIPNVAGIGALATEIVNWGYTGTRQAEEDLGE